MNERKREMERDKEKEHKKGNLWEMLAKMCWKWHIEIYIDFYKMNE